jgi:hypothetical protein
LQREQKQEKVLPVGSFEGVFCCPLVQELLAQKKKSFFELFAARSINTSKRGLHRRELRLAAILFAFAQTTRGSRDEPREDGFDPLLNTELPVGSQPRSREQVLETMLAVVRAP